MFTSAYVKFRKLPSFIHDVNFGNKSSSSPKANKSRQFKEDEFSIATGQQHTSKVYFL